MRIHTQVSISNARLLDRVGEEGSWTRRFVATAEAFIGFVGTGHSFECAVAYNIPELGPKTI